MNPTEIVLRCALTIWVGILLSAAYSSLRRLTKSSSMSSTVAFAVSRCFDRSGLRSTLEIFSIGIRFMDMQYFWKCSANVTPIMSVRATSMSLLCRPSSCVDRTK